jgi:hypothetical protein
MTSSSSSEEDFELELRSLPGVLNVGISHLDNGDVDAVTLSVRDQDPDTVRDVAMHISSLYYPDVMVTVEDANRAPTALGGDSPRVALLFIDFNENEGVSEVHLGYEGRVGIGLSSSGPLIGGAEATVGALQDLGYEIPCYLMAATTVHTTTGWPVIVTFRSPADGGDRIGIAQAEGELESAAKATLDALNRYLSAPKAPQLE